MRIFFRCNAMSTRSVWRKRKRGYDDFSANDVIAFKVLNDYKIYL
jgi:hypothetical protein